MDVGVLTVSHFRPHVGSRFRLQADDVLDVELVEVDEVGRPLEGARAPFSIVFVGPPEPVLPQRIYRLEHPELGAFELFLVPIGPGEYEAVFT